MTIRCALQIILAVELTVGSVGGIRHAGARQFITLDAPRGPHFTYATGINAQGDIVGYYEDSAAITHGFLLHQGLYTTFDEPKAIPGSGTFAQGINSQGDIVGEFRDHTGVDGFLLRHGHYTAIDDPKAVDNAMYGVWGTS